VATCPAGHATTAEDYCDICGVPVGACLDAGVAVPTAPTPTAPAPHAPRPPGATEETEVRATAVAPAPAGGDVDWVVEVWIDSAWYAEQESPDPLPSAGAPVVRALRGRSLLVGRTSQSRNIHPDVDCESDSGVSRRQCQLTTDGTRWWVEDLGSANGTFVGRASGALPEDPVPAGTRQELRPDDRVYVGAWTRLVIRRATEEERASLG